MYQLHVYSVWYQNTYVTYTNFHDIVFLLKIWRQKIRTFRGNFSTCNVQSTPICSVYMWWSLLKFVTYVIHFGNPKYRRITVIIHVRLCFLRIFYSMGCFTTVILRLGVSKSLLVKVSYPSLVLTTKGKCLLSIPKMFGWNFWTSIIHSYGSEFQS